MFSRFRSEPQRWASALALLFVSIALMGLVLAAVADWHDSWREYSRQTTLSGPCAVNPEAPECLDNNFEPWMVVPWGLAVGFVATALAIAWPTIMGRGGDRRDA